MQPIDYMVAFRGANWDDLGYFTNQYAPHGRRNCDRKSKIGGECNGKCEGGCKGECEGGCKGECKDGDIKNVNEFNDATKAYHEWLETARQDCVVNGLDYVTEVGYDLF